ncbi:MAG: DNA-binding domain-containing protein [Micropepsaceae bacterium]
MLPLAEQHRAIRNALLLGHAVQPGLISGSTDAAELRVDIHRNHFFRSLTKSLASVFPATSSLTSPRFFAYCAHEFISTQPPTSPCLFEYGATFADFIRSFPPCSGLPYLADVAMLEWLVHEVFHAPDEGNDFRFMQSRFPAHQIWRAALEPDAPAVDINSGTAHLLVYREGGDSSILVIGPEAYALLDSCAKDLPLPQERPPATLGSTIPPSILARLSGNAKLREDFDV